MRREVALTPMIIDFAEFDRMARAAWAACTTFVLDATAAASCRYEPCGQRPHRLR